MNKFTFLLAGCLLGAGVSTAQADIVFSGNWSSDGGTGTMQITDDIVFTITGNGAISVLAFDDVVPANDGHISSAIPSGAQNLAYTRQGMAATSGILVVYDNYHQNVGALDTTDGLILLNNIIVTNGDSFVIHAGTYTFSGSNTFNPLYDSFTFTGNVFATDNAGVALTNSVSVASTAVPEPSSLALMSMGALGLVARRRRKKASDA